MEKLDFLVVGCMKAGTTTVVNYLKENKEIFCHNNELQYFSNFKNYETGENWYHSHIDFNSGSRVTGEKSTAYSYVKEAPERIYKYNPKLKIVWVFREPIRRTYSNYWHAVMTGVERRCFSECITNGQNKSENIYKDYVGRSIYVEQVKRYLEYFPIEQMHFLFIEELWQEKDKTLKALFDFLGVSQEIDSSVTNFKSNAGYKPWSISLEYYTRKYFGSTIVWKLVHRLNKIFGSTYPRIDSESEEKLRLLFSEKNEELFEVLGIKRQVW